MARFQMGSDDRLAGATAPISTSHAGARLRVCSARDRNCHCLGNHSPVAVLSYGRLERIDGGILDLAATPQTK
jgi:hypothetical protein